MISSTPADAEFQLAEQKQGGFDSGVFPASRRGSSLVPLCHPVSEEPVTRFSRSDMMRSDGSFLQNSSLPLIHPYQRAKPSSYSTPLKNPSAYWS